MRQKINLKTISGKFKRIQPISLQSSQPTLFKTHSLVHKRIATQIVHRLKRNETMRAKDSGIEKGLSRSGTTPGGGDMAGSCNIACSLSELMLAIFCTLSYNLCDFETL